MAIQGPEHTTERPTVGNRPVTEEARVEAEQTKMKAEHAKHETKQNAKAKADQLRAQGREAAAQARERVRETYEQACEYGSEFVEDQKNRAADELNRISKGFRAGADELRSEGDATVGRLAGLSADQLESGAQYIREHDSGELIDEVRGFSRRHPEAFIGGMVVAGLALARFLRASEEKRYREEHDAYEADYGQELRSGRSSTLPASGEPGPVSSPPTVTGEHIHQPRSV